MLRGRTLDRIIAAYAGVQAVLFFALTLSSLLHDPFMTWLLMIPVNLALATAWPLVLGVLLVTSV